MSISAKLVGRCLLAAYKCFRRPMAWQLKRMGLRLAGQSRCRLRLEEAVRLVQSMCARLPVRRARDSTSFAKDSSMFRIDVMRFDRVAGGASRVSGSRWLGTSREAGVQARASGSARPARSLIGKFVAPTAWGHAHFRTEFSI